MHPGLLLFDTIQRKMKNALSKAIRLLLDNDKCIKKKVRTRQGRKRRLAEGLREGWIDREQKDRERNKSEIEFD